MPVHRFEQANMDLNLTGNNDPNKALHLDHEKSAPRVAEYYASRGIEKELAGDELVANGELFLNWLERVFTQGEKSGQLITGFDCRFFPTFFKNGILDIFHDIPEQLNEDLNKQGIRAYEIALAHSIPLHLRRKEGYDEAGLIAFVMEHFGGEVQKYYDETVHSLGDNPTLEAFSRKIKDSFTLEKIMKKVLDAAISGKIYTAGKDQEPRNLINMNPGIYNITSLLGDRVEKRQKRRRYIVLDGTYGDIAGTYEMVSEVKGKPIFEHRFTFTKDSLSAFCSSIGITVKDYANKYGWIITPMLCAYSFVPAIYRFGTQEHVNTSLLAEAKKRFGIENMDEIHLTKMYDGQAVVSDMRFAIPFNTIEVKDAETGETEKQIADTEVTLLLSYEPGKRNPSLIPPDRRIKVGEETSFIRKTGVNITVLDAEGHPYVGAKGSGFEMVSKK